MSTSTTRLLSGLRTTHVLIAAVATASFVALAVIPVALGVPPANGRDYILANHQVYQFSDGAYHLVPDVATGNAMGIQWNRLIKAGTLAPLGSPIPSVLPPPPPIQTRPPTVMANGRDYIVPNGNVYQFMGGSFHLIPDVLTANAMKVQWDKLIGQKSVGPIGAPIQSVIVTPQPVCSAVVATSAKANGRDDILPNGEVYQFSNGSFHLVPDVATANAMGLRWNYLTRASSVNPVGAPIPSVCFTS